MSREIKLLPLSSQSTLQNCLTMPLDQKTIFVASYPKSGTTWMQWIIYRLILPSDIVPDSNFHISNASPFFEIDPHWDENGQPIENIRQYHANQGVRIFNTHLPWNMMPKRGNVKYIYVVRKGRDVCTSFYHHLSNQVGNGGFEGNFHEFITQWSTGKLPYGAWIPHMDEWIQASLYPENNTLIIYYEDLINNLPQNLHSIAKHIGYELSEEKLESLLHTFSFNYMKENIKFFQPISVSWKNDFKFIRKGIIGDNLNIFDVEDEECFVKMIHEYFPDGNLPEWISRLL